MAAANVIDILIQARDEATRVLKTVEDSINSMAAVAEESKKSFEVLDKVAAGLRTIGTAAIGAGVAMTAAFTAPVTAIGAMGIAFNSMTEGATIGFTTMLGSAEKAQKFVSDMKDFAARTPFEFPGLVSATQKMLAFGFTIEQVMPTLKAVGDAAAGLGGGTELIDRITRALGQMRAKGAVSAEEMRQLAEAGIPAWEILASKIGKSIPEAMKLAQKKALDADSTIKMLVEGMSARFDGLMEKQATSMTGLMSTIKDELRFMAGAFTSGIFQSIKGPLQAIAVVLNVIRKTVELIPGPVLTVIAVFGLLLAAIGPLLIAFGGLAFSLSSIISLVKEVGPWVRTATIAIKEFTVALYAAATAEKALATANLAASSAGVLNFTAQTSGLEKFKTVAKSVATAISGFFTGTLLTFIKGITIDGVLGKITAGLNLFKPVIANLGTIVGVATKALSILSIVLVGLSFVKGAVQALELGKAFDKVSESAESVIGPLKAMLGPLLELLGAFTSLGLELARLAGFNIIKIVIKFAVEIPQFLSDLLSGEKLEGLKGFGGGLLKGGLETIAPIAKSLGAIRDAANKIDLDKVFEKAFGPGKRLQDNLAALDKLAKEFGTDTRRAGESVDQYYQRIQDAAAGNEKFTKSLKDIEAQETDRWFERVGRAAKDWAKDVGDFPMLLQQLLTGEQGVDMKSKMMATQGQAKEYGVRVQRIGEPDMDYITYVDAVVRASNQLKNIKNFVEVRKNADKTQGTVGAEFDLMKKGVTEATTSLEGMVKTPERVAAQLRMMMKEGKSTGEMYLVFAEEVTKANEVLKAVPGSGGKTTTEFLKKIGDEFKKFADDDKNKVADKIKAITDQVTKLTDEAKYLAPALENLAKAGIPLSVTLDVLGDDIVKTVIAFGRLGQQAPEAIRKAFPAAAAREGSAFWEIQKKAVSSFYNKWEELRSEMATAMENAGKSLDIADSFDLTPLQRQFQDLTKSIQETSAEIAELLSGGNLEKLIAIKKIQSVKGAQRQAIETTANFEASFRAFQDEDTGLQRTLQEIIGGASELGIVLTPLGEQLLQNAEAYKQAGGMMTEAQKIQIEELKRLKVTIDAINEVNDLSENFDRLAHAFGETERVKGFSAAVAVLGDEFVRSALSAQAAGKAIDAATEAEIVRIQAHQLATQTLQAMEAAARAPVVIADALIELTKGDFSKIKDFVRHMDPDAIIAAAEAAKKLKEPLNDAEKAALSAAVAIAKQAKASEALRDALSHALGETIHELARSMTEVAIGAKDLKEALKDIFKNLGKSILTTMNEALLAPLLQLIQNMFSEDGILGGLIGKLSGLLGGGIGKGVGALAGKAFGDLAGKTIGAVAGPIIGSVIGMGISAIAGAFGKGRKAANEFVRQSQNPFGDKLGAVLDPYTGGFNRGELTKVEAMETREQITAAFDAFKKEAADYATLGKTEAKVAAQALATMEPIVNQILGDLDKNLETLGATAKKTQMEFERAVEAIVASVTSYADNSDVLEEALARLTAAGIPTSLILEAQASAIEETVDQMTALGQSIPPTISALYELIGANEGVAESAKSAVYGMTQVTVFTNAAADQTVKTLKKALDMVDPAVELSSVFNRTGASVTRATSTNWTPDTIQTALNMPTSFPSDVPPSIPHSSAAALNAAATSGSTATTKSSGVSGPVTVVIQIDGKAMASVLIPDISKAVENDGQYLVATTLKRN